MDSDSDTSSVIMDSDGNIDWDTVNSIFKKNKQETTFQFVCKKCGQKFDCKNYRGKYPLCFRHRIINTSSSRS